MKKYCTSEERLAKDLFNNIFSRVHKKNILISLLSFVNSKKCLASSKFALQPSPQNSICAYLCMHFRSPFFDPFLDTFLYSLFFISFFQHFSIHANDNIKGKVFFSLQLNNSQSFEEACIVQNWKQKMIKITENSSI